MVLCAVIHCSNRSGRDKVSFFKLPSVPPRSTHKDLIKKRRNLWLSRLNRIFLSETSIKNIRVCSKHFVTGKPSDLLDELNPDWAPSIHLGYNTKTESATASENYNSSVQHELQTSNETEKSANTTIIDDAKISNNDSVDDSVVKSGKSANANVTDDAEISNNDSAVDNVMPRKYVRITQKVSWTKEQLKEALNCIKNGEKIRAVGRKFGIDESTLRRRLKIGIPEGPNMGRKGIFTKEEEEEISSHFLDLSKQFYRVTIKELRRLAFEYAELNNIKHKFNKKTRLAGKDWATSFLKRNPQLNLRKHKALLIDKAFDNTEMDNFYLNLKTVMEKCNFLNMDETDIKIVHELSSLTDSIDKEESSTSCSMS